MLSKNINIPASININDQTRDRNNIEEAKEEPIFIGRTPELSYPLHFTPAPSLNHPDAGFEMHGISRDTLVTALLNELAKCQKADNRFHNIYRSAVRQFKRVFADDIKAALKKGLLIDEKGLKLYQQKQNYFAKLHAIQQHWQYKSESIYKLIDFLKKKQQAMADEPKNSQVSNSVNEENNELEECKAEAQPLQPLDEPNKQQQLQQLQEDINSLQHLLEENPTASLDDYCIELFDQYIELLKKDLPLVINNAFRYAQITELPIYIWEQDKYSNQNLFLIKQILNKSSQQAPIHILSYQGQLIKLNNLRPAIPLSPTENTVIENEMEQARKIIGLSAENKLLTKESALLETTELPKDLTRIIIHYQNVDKSFTECIEENVIDFASSTFWEDVVGRFPIISLYPLSSKLIGAPDAKLLASKLSNSTGSTKLFEPWAHAILLHHVKKLKPRQEVEVAGDNFVFARPGRRYKIEFIHKHIFNGPFDADTEDSELVQLKQQLNSLSLDLLLMLLQDQDVLSVIQYYPRLQAVFLERILKESPPFSEQVNEVISRWVDGIDDFVFYRIINSLLLSSATSLAKVKTIPSINIKLIQHGLDRVEEEHSFVNAVCQNVFRFINKELNQVNAKEHFTYVFIKPGSNLAEVTQEFTQYCQTEDAIADWYIIYQYLITGVDVSSDLLGKFISQSNRQAVRAILQIPDIDANNYYDKITFLMRAAENGDAEIVAELLAQAEVNVNKTCIANEEYEDYSDYTALALAVYHHHVDVAALLLAVPGIIIGKCNIKNEKSSIISLAFKNIDNKQLRMKDYQLIQLLFQAETLSKLTAQEFEELFSFHNILSTAAAISHDVIRCANLVMNMDNIVYHPDIIEFLLQIPGVDTTIVLIKLANAYNFEKCEVLFSRIVSRPEITAESINETLLKLIKNIYTFEETNAHKFAIINILLKHPAFDVNKAGLLATALSYPAIIRLLLAHPNLDKYNIISLLIEKINQRKNLVEEEVTKALMPKKMPNNSSSAVSLDDLTTVGETFFEEEEKDNAEPCTAAELGSIINNIEDAIKVSKNDNEISQQIALEEEQKKRWDMMRHPAYWMKKIKSMIDNMNEVVIISDETIMEKFVPENVRLDQTHNLFWPIKRKQIKLLKEIHLLTEASCLLAEDFIPLIELAANSSLTDIINILLSTPQMQAVVYNYIEHQHQAANDKLSQLYRFFNDKKFINLPGFTLIAKCISLLAEHTDKNIAETILSYINGASANENRVWAALGAMRISATGELNEQAVVDEMTDELYQASPR